MIAIDDLVPLARGGTAELFTARSGGVRVVVKQAREDRPGAAAALAAEAAVLARLDGGAAPRLLGRTRVAGREALVLEHLAMPTLRAAAPPPDDRIAIAAAVCAAVAQIHAAGVVHADLTPDNILVDPRRGAVRVIDFGVAAPIGSVLAPLVTVGYAAPERRVAGCRADPAIDVYALGVICYELLAGAAPFDGAPGERRVGHAAHRVPRIAERAAVPAAIDDAVARAMAKHPAQRPAGADALAAALTAALTAAPVRRPARRDAAHSPARPALLIGFRWTAGAATVRDAAARAGAVIAYSEEDRHVAAIWQGDARGAAARLAAELVALGAGDLEIVEADIHVGASGVPRGGAIIALGRRSGAPVGPGNLEIIEADIHVGASGVPRGGAIIALGRRSGAPAGPGNLEIIEADLHIGASGVPRGGAIIALGRPSGAQVSAGDLEIVEADIHVGASGVPRGGAIIALERCASPSPSPAPRIECGSVAAPPAAMAPLIAREPALAAIEAAGRAVAAGGCALVTVWAAAGLGKSRLVEAAVPRLRDAGLAVVHTRAPGLAAMIELAAAGGDRTGAASAVDRAALDAIAGRRAIAGSAAEQLAAAAGALRQAAARALAAILAGAGPRAIVVDDAHSADPIVLDALELATLAPGAGVLVLALARPALAATRPRWGRRAARAEAIALEPLDREAGCRLVRALLPAGAAVPRAALDRLVDRAGGVPLHLVELVAAVLRADRARGETTAATRGALPTDLVELPAEIGVIAWAVADELAALPAGAAAAAEALAVGARDVARAEVSRLFDALDAAGVAIDLDPGVAIADLVAAGVLVDAPGVSGAPGAHRALRFRHDLVRDAIAQRVDPARRGAIHRAMLGLATTPDERARHAEGAGDRATAAIAWHDAARAALARHDDLAAETALGRALACSEARDAARGAVLRQRGGARARLGRHDAAARDFAAARELACAAGDHSAAIDVLLDEATALDWALHYQVSAARAGEAAALAHGDEPPLRRARLAMAAARTMWRAGDGERAIAPCRAAIALADAVGADGYATAIACRLMLGFILGGRGDTEAAAAILDEALAEATARGDLLHIAAARCNRYPVHAARGDAAGLRADLAAFAAAGRELGVAVTEYRGELYQALVGLWCDDDAGALVHARAARRVEAADPALFPRPRAALVLAELAARRDDAPDAAAWCHLARPGAAADTAAAIDLVMLDGLTAWLAGRLTLSAATALAHRAIAVAEHEAAFQLLELTARTAARRGDPFAAAAAHRAARTLPAHLPRFIAGASASA